MTPREFTVLVERYLDGEMSLPEFAKVARFVLPAQVSTADALESCGYSRSMKDLCDERMARAVPKILCHNCGDVLRPMKHNTFTCDSCYRFVSAESG